MATESVRKPVLQFTALLAALVVLVLLNLVVGSVYIPLKDVLHPSGAYAEIIYIIRLPEAIGAVIAGASLAVAGAIMQAVFRNPLAEPYVTGTASGAVLGVLCGFALGILVHGLFGFALFLEPLFGFAGAMLATFLVIMIGRRGEWLSLILSGIAISTSPKRAFPLPTLVYFISDLSSVVFPEPFLPNMVFIPGLRISAYTLRITSFFPYPALRSMSLI